MNDATTSLLTEHFSYTPLVSYFLSRLQTALRAARASQHPLRPDLRHHVYLNLLADIDFLSPCLVLPVAD